ncbi:hypothetical protein ATE92_0607 [Ulvibacter sp. MAR_2010_11]|uniref:hypothetical protein n=1 Tax=Ulvibacter sp. MAR_2010_11 TaxID=1250229 RepID=UPI000C2C5CB2|nr:hypothetical protein [Ulvibacter sp. MAR_2010_11]PKA82477.1 hypothetical protein ATE92_0607 [Ulvibacter sp. MAR_2010_11]
MDKATYIQLLANPQTISKENLSQLSTVIEKYPYFQSARALQLKGLKNENSFLYNDALKVTAAYTTDRDILFDYITSKHFVQNEIAQVIQQHDASVLEMEVVAESVSEAISLELDKQMKVELKKADAIFNPELFQRKLESIKEIVPLPQPESEPTALPASEVSLEMDKPLEFTKDDTHSFGEWLKLTTAAPIQRTEESEQVSLQEKKFQLIEKFIQQKPKMKPVEISSANKDLAEPFTQSSDALMTETLAKVYVQQKNYTKAIQAYKILILKYPEKSGYFADQIRAVKNLINTEEQ